MQLFFFLFLPCRLHIPYAVVFFFPPRLPSRIPMLPFVVVVGGHFAPCYIYLLAAASSVRCDFWSTPTYCINHGERKKKCMKKMGDF